jgi:tetratricopeptide (TPR) repeat protein
MLAEEDLSSALSLSTEQSVIREVARGFGTLQSWERVHETIAKAPIQDGMDPDLVLSIDSALFTGQYDEVEKLIELADPEHPEKWTIRAIKADFLARTGDLERSLLVLDELAANGFTAKDARINIASALGEAENFSVAFEILRPCLISPISADFPRLAGQLQLSMHDPTRALQYLVEAYRMAPNDWDTRKLFLLAAKAKRSLGGGLTFGENAILKEIQGL